MVWEEQVAANLVFETKIDVKTQHTGAFRSCSARLGGMRRDRNCSRVGRLVQTNLAAARQCNGRLEPPFHLLNFHGTDALRFQRLDARTQVIAHEVENCSKEIVRCVTLNEVLAGGMNGDFGGGQREYQPTLPRIDSAKPKHVTKELPIGVRILAAQQEVSTGDHARWLQRRFRPHVFKLSHCVNICDGEPMR